MVERFDKSPDSNIVSESQLNKETPLEGVGCTDQRLTTQADNGSLEAMQNPISALSSRQLLSSAVDGFFVEPVDIRSPSASPITLAAQLLIVWLLELADPPSNP